VRCVIQSEFKVSKFSFVLYYDDLSVRPKKWVYIKLEYSIVQTIKKAK